MPTFKPTTPFLDEVVRVGAYIYPMGASIDPDDPDYIDAFIIDSLGNKVYDHQLTFYTDADYISEFLDMLYMYYGFIGITHQTRLSTTHVRVSFTTTKPIDDSEIEWVN